MGSQWKLLKTGVPGSEIHSGSFILRTMWRMCCGWVQRARAGLGRLLQYFWREVGLMSRACILDMVKGCPCRLTQRLDIAGKEREEGGKHETKAFGQS